MSVILNSLGFYNKNSTQTVWLKQQNLFLTILEAGIQRQECQHEGFLVKFLFLFYKRPSHCILIWQRERKEASSVLCPLKSAPVALGRLKIHYLITSPKSPISKYYHIGHQSFNMPILGKQTSSIQQVLQKKRKKKKTRVEITAQQVWDLIEEEGGISNQKYSTAM